VPDEGVAPLAADDGVVAGAARHGQSDQTGGQGGGVHRVVAAEGVHHQGGEDPPRAGDVHKGNKTHRGVDLSPDGGHLADVVPGGAVEDDRVGLAVAGTRGATEVQVERVQAGRGLVVDGDGVGAAQGGEVNLLDAAQVHGDAADVAGEPDAVAVRREV